MDNDDILVGRLLSRREVLAIFGVAGAALVVGCSDNGSSKTTPTSGATEALTGAATEAATSAAANGVPSCVVRPAETEGPYFVDEKLNRSDIRSDPTDGSVKDGVPLVLTFAVSEVGSGSSCTPLTNATVDVWHCDAVGVYSDVADNAQGFNTVGKKFLRGHQVTDSSGKAQFTTIYPGWYQGPDGTHPLQDKDAVGEIPRVHFAAVFRRKCLGPAVCSRAVLHEGPTVDQKRE